MSAHVAKPNPATPAPLAIIMAKWPAPGLVKTRLISPGISELQAAAIAGAFLNCITLRLSLIFGGRVIIAISPGSKLDCMSAAINELHSQLSVAPTPSPAQLIEHPIIQRILPQGEGDLGTRINHVWQQIRQSTSHANVSAAGASTAVTGVDASAIQQPVAFFGLDSPDLPNTLLENLHRQLAGPEPTFEVAAGPTPDGGYWTLASRGYHPEVLRQVEWGGPTVFATTQKRAEEFELKFIQLPDWYDVDEPTDLAQLRERLRETNDPILNDLEHKLAAILGGSVAV